MSPQQAPSRVFLKSAVWLFFTVGLIAALTDNSIHIPPDYFGFLPPAVGHGYADPVFGTRIKRITDALNTIDLGTGSHLAFITNEYSTMSPFNQDNSRLLLIHQSYFGLYDGQGNFIKALPFEINASSEPRWSRRDPNVLYYRVVGSNQFKQYNVATGISSVVHTFREYSVISGKGESDISFDGDHFVLSGDGHYIFVYQISTDVKGPVLDAGQHAFDSLYITPSNNVIVSWIQPGTARFNGMELFDSGMTFQRQLTRAGGHMDITLDTNGDEILVWNDNGDPAAVCTNGIVKVRLSDGRQTCLVSLDRSLNVNISGPDNSGWILADTYAPSDPNPGTSSWVTYTNEILQIQLNGSQVLRIAHHRSRPFPPDTYDYTPRVSVSRDGSLFVYSSNFGLQFLQGVIPQYTDVYLVNSRQPLLYTYYFPLIAKSTLPSTTTSSTSLTSSTTTASTSSTSTTTTTTTTMTTATTTTSTTNTSTTLYTYYFPLIAKSTLPSTRASSISLTSSTTTASTSTTTTTTTATTTLRGKAPTLTTLH